MNKSQSQKNDQFASGWTLQARDEEKNRRNNKDSTNQVMKDLEDLLPNKSLIPPPTEEEDTAPAGTIHSSIFYTHLLPPRHTRTHTIYFFLITDCRPVVTCLTSTFFLFRIHRLRSCSREGQQVSENETRCCSQRGQSAEGRVPGCSEPQSSSDPCPRATKRASWKCQGTFAWSWERKRTTSKEIRILVFHAPNHHGNGQRTVLFHIFTMTNQPVVRNPISLFAAVF